MNAEMTWKEISSIEPRLLNVENRLWQGAYFGDEDQLEAEAWEKIKAELSTLVGWKSPTDSLRNSGAYEFCCRYFRARLSASWRAYFGEDLQDEEAEEEDDQ